MEGPVFWAAAVLVGKSKGGLPVVGMSDVFGLCACRHSSGRRVLAIVVLALSIGVAPGLATENVMPGWLATAPIGAALALSMFARRNDGPPAQPASAAGYCVVVSVPTRPSSSYGCCPNAIGELDQHVPNHGSRTGC